MKLVTFASDQAARLGAIVADGSAIVDLTGAGGGTVPAFASMQALIDAGEPGLEAAKAIVAEAPAALLRPIGTIRLLPPLPQPVRMRDCQLFHEHVSASWKLIARKAAEKSGTPEAAYNASISDAHAGVKPILRERVIYYNVDTLSMAGVDDEIPWPAESDWMDYELEWAVVLGKGGIDIPQDAANAHIFGYTIYNDFSARDVQLRVMEATLGPGAGKDFDRSNSIGPCIVTRDEFTNPYDRTMLARINGEEWSRGTTGSMYHSFEFAISNLSIDRTMYAGEMIASGTVLTGCGFELERQLRHDDVIELEIEGIGILRNRIRSLKRCPP